jgi:hypothetical protein
MDIFHEQIVKKPNTGLRMLAIGGIITGFLIACALCFIFLGFLFPVNLLLIVGLIYLCWYIVTGMSIEYEYILTNDDLDIDKIIAKRKRKRLISIKMSSFSDMAVLTNENANAGEKTLVNCAGTEYKAYAADFKHEKMGDCRLVFTPSEEMLEALVKVMPRQIRQKFKETSIS